MIYIPKNIFIAPHLILEKEILKNTEKTIGSSIFIRDTRSKTTKKGKIIKIDKNGNIIFRLNETHFKIKSISYSNKNQLTNPTEGFLEYYLGKIQTEIKQDSIKLQKLKNNHWWNI